jgi:hypothetical protein
MKLLEALLWVTVWALSLLVVQLLIGALGG